MRESFVNRYVVVLGHGGLGGTAYEIHATLDDLRLLAKNLEEQLTLFREGKHALQEAMEREGLEWREDVAFPVLSEYVTLSEIRTDRMCIRFCVERSLEEHHVMKSAQWSAESLGLGLGKVLWFVVLPVVGIIACLRAFYGWVSG